MLQFGRQLILVGSSGAEMTPLCTLHDPDEVAEVLGQLGAAKGHAGASFRSAFKGAEKQFEAPHADPADVDEPEPADDPAVTEDVSGLMARIRRMNDQFQRT